MSTIKKKLVLLGILASIASVSLTGCHSAYKINYTHILTKYKNDEVIGGSVPYDEIKGNIKVVILEQNGTIKPYLMVKEKFISERDSVILKYINLKNHEEMLRYYWEANKDPDNDEPDKILVGKYITILEEIEFYDYLYEYGDIVNDLDIMEIVKIYEEKEPELIEYISKEYNYTRSISN